MIEEIRIRDLGVIAEAQLPVGPGFTAITGETGAGKTMVVTALGLVLGARGDSGAVRAGSGGAIVEARWLVPDDGPVAARVREAGGELDPADEGRVELIVGRSVSAEGRSRATVGGRSVPIGVLDELGGQLVVVHGQSDQLRLRSARAQRNAVDRFGGAELLQALDLYRDHYSGWLSLTGQLETLVAERDRRAQEAEELRASLAEIEELAPRRGEQAELAELAERLGNLEELRQAAISARESISAQYSDTIDAAGRVAEARHALERVASHDTALAPVIDALAAARDALVDASGQLSG